MLPKSVSLCVYFTNSFQKKVHGSLAHYFSKNAWIQKFFYIFIWFTSIVGYPLALPIIAQMLATLSGDKELSPSIVQMIIGGIWATSQFSWCIFIFMILRAKQEFMFSRGDAATQIGFTEEDK